MADFYNGKLSIAFDIYGCPQHCRHCWVGSPNHAQMDWEEAVASFSKLKAQQGEKQYYGFDIEFFSPDVREPHFGGDYRQLYEIADQLNGCIVEVEKSFELLSLWRLTRDPSYVKWAKERGIQRCQLKVFGLEETNDFFYGRRGSHGELIEGTRILLENGIIPRWQIYLNKMGIGELEGVLELTRELNLWERVKELGEEFNIHTVTFDSDGRGFDHHHLRISAGDEELIPQTLWDKSVECFGNGYGFFREQQLIEEILSDYTSETLLPQDHWLWFFVSSNWDVYPNLMGIAPWWKLGNLKTDSWENILNHYAENRVIGLQVLSENSGKTLALKYGDRQGDKLFSGRQQLVDYLVGRACRDLYRAGQS